MDSVFAIKIDSLFLKNLAILFAGFFLCSCNTGRCVPNRNDSEKTEISSKETNSVLPEKIKVYKFDGSKQCGQGQPISIVELEKELQGIEVFSRATKNDGQMRIQMCGAPTGVAHIFEIRKEDLTKAKKTGFKEWIFE